jgi:hypothetical protein
MDKEQPIQPAPRQPQKHGLKPLIDHAGKTKAKNGRKTAKVESNGVNEGSTQGRELDSTMPKEYGKNTPSQPLESMQTSDHDSVGVLSSNGNKGTLAAIRATVEQYLANQPSTDVEIDVGPAGDSSVVDIRFLAPRLREAIEKYKHDPEACFADIFPRETPVDWQKQVAADISNRLRIDPTRCWTAIASGKGVGKTREMAKYFIWHVTMHPNSQTCLTATTGRQTDTRVWKEVKRLLRSSWLSEYFKVDNTKLVHKHIDTWSGFTQPWNAERPEAFQGLHGEYLAVFVDEASGVPDEILLVIEEGMTDQHTFLMYCSNPTRPVGRFKECFPGGQYHADWKTYTIDARTVPLVTPQSIAKRLRDVHGNEEADNFRVSVRGEFPRLLGQYFISQDMIKAAQQRIYTPNVLHPYIMGCDISGGGMSASVAIIRQGQRLVEKHVHHNVDEVSFTGFIANIIKRYTEQGIDLHVFIEAVSYGRATVSLLKEQGFKRIIPVNPGLIYPSTAEYPNWRAAMADEMKKWIMNDACLSKDEQWENLYAQLTKIKSEFDSLGRLKMEDKYLMLQREGGLFDEADALATTFAQYVPARQSFRGYSASDDRRGLPTGPWLG